MAACGKKDSWLFRERWLKGRRKATTQRRVRIVRTRQRTVSVERGEKGTLKIERRGWYSLTHVKETIRGLRPGPSR